MNKTCFYCKTEKAQNEGWIKENHYQGDYSRILKCQPIKTVYYCSWSCMMTRQDKKLWERWLLSI